MLRILYTPEQNTHEINFICQNTFHVRTNWINHISENTITVIPHLLPSVFIDYIFFPTHPGTCGTDMDTADDLWAQKTATLRFVPHFMLIVTDESR